MRRVDQDARADRDIVTQCDFWFPLAAVPTGPHQVLTAQQLLVLAMITGYVRWASAALVPIAKVEGLFAGW
jgi:hypothetical protein